MCTVCDMKAAAVALVIGSVERYPTPNHAIAHFISEAKAALDTGREDMRAACLSLTAAAVTLGAMVVYRRDGGTADGLPKVVNDSIDRFFSEAYAIAEGKGDSFTIPGRKLDMSGVN